MPNNLIKKSSFSVPVALFLFNRPKELKAVFDVIQQVKPGTLFLIADGPRAQHPKDIENCNQARLIVSQINWPCKVRRLFFEKNQSSRNAIPLGLNWVFSQVERCIILEDDCVPSHSFFNYCADLLDLYENHSNIMTIGGHRFDGPDESNQESYFFSKYPSTWGWATWRRSWELFDLELNAWSTLKKKNWLKGILNNPRYENYWARIFNQMQDGMDAWDYALLFSCWVNQGLSIRPKVNLIHNIGHNSSGTHTTNPNFHISSRKAIEINIPLLHPQQIKCDPLTEDRIEWVSYSGITQRAIEFAHAKIKSRQTSG